MDHPRILAIDDVHLAADPHLEPDLTQFYGALLGFQRLEQETSDTMVFRGFPRSGPRLVVRLAGEPEPEKPMRRQVLIQVASLWTCAAQLRERRTPFDWTHGLTYYDQRVSALDPAGNRVELVASHPI